MKLLFVTDVSIQKVIGGAERVLYEQTHRLAAKGHEVHILTRRLPVHETDHAVIRGVTEWRYFVDQSNSALYFLSILGNGKKLFDEIAKRHSFDCINFHQPFSAYAVLKSKVTHKTRKVYTCLSFAFEEYASRNARPSSPDKKIFHALHLFSRRWIEQRALRQSDKIVALSRFTCNKLHDVYGFSLNEILIIPAGIDQKRFQPPVDKRAVRERLHIKQEETVLLTVRNLVPRMGLENLLRAMRHVTNSVPNVRLIIGGTGPLLDELTALSRDLDLEEHVNFMGFIPEADLPCYYQAADLFILPTVELEGFGLVTLEALACGTPVLGTPVGATEEILGRLDKKFLFNDATPESISRSISDRCRSYLYNPDQWCLDSRRCRDFIEKNYSWDANLEVLERVFRGDPA